MRLRYHHATISFCPNLRNPEGADPIPLGVLFLGEADGFSVAMLKMKRELEVPGDMPEVVTEIVRDMPRLLEAQIMEALKAGGCNIDTIMSTFEDSLRNSFYVSHVKMNQVLDVEVPTVQPAVEWMYR